MIEGSRYRRSCDKHRIERLPQASCCRECEEEVMSRRRCTSALVVEAAFLVLLPGTEGDNSRVNAVYPAPKRIQFGRLAKLNFLLTF